MYREIWKKYLEELPGFPKERRPLIGPLIQEKRVDKDIPQYRFAEQVGLNLSTLKSIENNHFQATTVENLEKCADGLKVSLEDLILEARERDPANFFVCKHKPPSRIEGLKEKKKIPQPWYKTMRFEFKNFDAFPLTPPIATKKDFFVCRIHLLPSCSIDNLVLGNPEQVFGFVSQGYSIKLLDKGKEAASLTANEGFRLEGNVKHSIRNEDQVVTAVIYLATKLSALDPARGRPHESSKSSAFLDMAHAIEHLRDKKSEDLGVPLRLKHLADMTDSLNEKKIRWLMKSKKSTSVIYWDKIEDLLGATGASMDEFLIWARGKEVSNFSVCPSRDRAMIDYTSSYGVKIYSTAFPSTENQFHMGEFYFEAFQKDRKRARWRRKDKSMTLISVEDGELRIQAGRNRIATLIKGESVYFDGAMGYLLNNPGNLPAKCFFATFPAIKY